MFAVLRFISLRTQLAVFAARTLQAHAQPAVDEDPQVLCSRAAPQPGSSQPVLFPGILLFKKQDLAFVLGEFYRVPVGPYLQPVQDTLDGSLLSTVSAVHSVLVCSENLRRLHSHFFEIIVLHRTGTRADPCSSTLFCHLQIEHKSINHYSLSPLPSNCLLTHLD